MVKENKYLTTIKTAMAAFLNNPVNCSTNNGNTQ